MMDPAAGPKNHEMKHGSRIAETVFLSVSLRIEYAEVDPC